MKGLILYFPREKEQAGPKKEIQDRHQKELLTYRSHQPIEEAAKCDSCPFLKISNSEKITYHTCVTVLGVGLMSNVLMTFPLTYFYDSMIWLSKKSLCQTKVSSVDSVVQFSCFSYHFPTFKLIFKSVLFLITCFDYNYIS